MPTVRCGKESCVHQYAGRCSEPYIYLKSDEIGPRVKCGGFKMDPEYEEALTKLATNPKLQRDKEEDET